MTIAAFQDDLDRIAAEKPPRLLRMTSVTLALLTLALIGISAVTWVDIVVTGHGRLAADHPTDVLQPLDRAIVRTLLVRPGDIVHKGEVLATLDPTFAAADLAALQSHASGLEAETARLQAEADGTVYVPAAGAGADGGLQLGLFTQRRREYAARLASFDQAVAHDASASVTIEGQRSAFVRQADIARNVRDLRETLLRGAVGSRLQYLEAEAALAHAEGDVQDATGRLSELSHATLTHRADRTAFIEGWRREVLDTLALRRAALADARAGVAKAARLRDLVVVTAPEDGVVLEVAARSPGSVLRDAEPLLTLLPAHAGLQAELTIRSADIGYMRVGDPVSLKIDAYPYQRHGILHGRVRTIEAASFEPDAAHPADPQGGGAMHRVFVDIQDTALQDMPPGTGPIPGMTVSGDVRVGTRSVLAYFLAPVTRGFQQSFREP
jgi:HlyD family secretion protein